jgi:hypothetical protein
VHYKGNEYEVYDLLNTDADPGREVDHPVIVCYRGPNGRKWGKTLEVFLKTMSPKVAEKSPWQQRKERINALVSQPESALTPAPKTGLLQQPIMPREFHDKAYGMELLTPEIRLWNSSHPKAVGAFAHIQLNPRGQEDPTDDADKLQFIRDLWEASKNEIGIRQTMTQHVFRAWYGRIELGAATNAVQNQIAEKHAAFIGLYQGQPIVSHWATSCGGSLYELTMFMSILRHISMKYQGEVYDERHIHMLAADFNNLVREAVVGRCFHPRGEPAAVVDNYRLRFLLPRHMKGPNEEEPQYAETEYSDNVLRIIFDNDTTALITEIFGADCLSRILI